MKKFFVLLSILFVMMFVVSCGAKPVTTPVPTADDTEPSLRDLQNGKPFVYVGNNFNHPTIKLMMLGFWDACQDYNVDCKFFVDPGSDDAAYLMAGDKAIAYGSSGLVGASYLQYFSVNLAAKKLGIPAVGFHGNLTGFTEEEKAEAGLIAWVAPDAIQYGGAVAQAIFDKAGCVSPVIVTQSSFNIAEDSANKGFHDKWVSLCPESEILETQQEGLEPVAAMAKISAILTANPDLKAAFGTTGGSINAWGKAMQQAGYEPGKVIMIGMDATQENIDMIKSGYCYMLVNQPVYEETYKAVEILIANMTGQPYEYDNPIPSPLIGMDGLADLEKLAARSQTDLP